jgi:hypothetical protein
MDDAALVRGFDGGGDLAADLGASCTGTGPRAIRPPVCRQARTP